MPVHTASRVVPFSPQQMFDLVAKVEDYPQFVPLCQDLHIRGEKAGPDDTIIIIADMTVAYKVITERFTSKVELDPATQEIKISYIDGPFRHMNGSWTFEPFRNETCKVSFHVDYDFRSRTLALLMGTMFERLFNKYTEAFEKRAGVIYGAQAS